MVSFGSWRSFTFCPLFWVLFLLSYPFSSFAQTPGQPPQAQPTQESYGGYQQIYQWAPKAYKNLKPTQGPEVSQIGIAFDRSVEIRSMMAEFISEKIESLNRASVAEANGARGDLQGVVDKLLGDFCIKKPVAESAMDCKNRYIMIQTPLVYKLRRGMADDQTHEAELVCTQRDKQGNCKVDDKTPAAFQAEVICIQRDDYGNCVKQSDPLKQTNYLPYIPTYADLQEYAKNRPTHSLSSYNLPMTESGYRAVGQGSYYPSAVEKKR